MEQERRILIFAELNPDKTISPISLECVRTARELADATGASLYGLVMGNSVGEAVQELAHYDLDRVVAMDDPTLDPYHPETHGSAFLKACETVRPKVILMGDTLTSIDLAPRLAFALKAGLITDCVGIEVHEGAVQFLKPVYSSNVMAAYVVTTEPAMATMRRRIVEPAEKRKAPKAETASLRVEPGPSVLRTEVIQRVLEVEKGPDLAASDIIVSGGRGIGGPKGFQQLSELAGILNAAVGSSRPPVDLGWISPKAQVGQTGEKVGPSVYIAVGISGAAQHIAGMMASKTVVAINKDPKANIFRIADYGVVENYEEVIPAMTEALKEAMLK